MSDLANSCEYINIDKLCTTFIDNQKAQANRQLKCRNDEKTACCYLCTFRPQCAISCKYLGQTENYTYSAPKTENPSSPKPDIPKEAEAPQVESVPVSFCFSCNTEMAWTKTLFTVEGWNGPNPAQANGKVLPVTVYLCPKCGKIEFKADTNSEAKQ